MIYFLFLIESFVFSSLLFTTKHDVKHLLIQVRVVDLHTSTNNTSAGTVRVPGSSSALREILLTRKVLRDL